MKEIKHGSKMSGIYFAPEYPAKEPLLQFNLYADQIAELIKRQTGGRAFVFAIHGPWGSGKTTLMKAVLRRLTLQSPKKGGLEPVVVEFNAWKFQDREVLWRALLLRVIGEIEGIIGKNEIERIRESLYRAFEVEERGPITVNYKNLVVEIVGAILKLWNLGFLTKLAKTFRSHRWFRKEADDEKGFAKEQVEEFLGVFNQEIVSTHIHKVESIEQFLNEFKGLVSQLREKRRSLIVFVDDLDRCLPESTLEIFEAIKLFMDVSGVTFTVCLDRDIIRKALKVRYERVKGSEGFVDPDEYIEKVITLAFQIPPMDGQAIDEYLNSLPISNRWTPECLDILKIGLQPNPRRLKRFVNGVELLFDLIDASGLKKPTNFERECLVKMNCLAYRWSHFFDQIAERPDAFIEFISLIDNKPYEEAIAEYVQSWPTIATSTKNRDLYNFLKKPPSFSGLNLEDIRKLISFFNLATGPSANQ